MSVGILDLFRGSKGERIARRYIKALRDAGEIRQMVHVPAERVVAILDEDGKRSQIAFLGNLEREISRASEIAKATYARGRVRRFHASFRVACPQRGRLLFPHVSSEVWGARPSPSCVALGDSCLHVS